MDNLITSEKFAKELDGYAQCPCDIGETYSE